MDIGIRPCNSDSDPGWIAGLLTALEPEPVSAEEVRKWMCHMPSGRIVCRLVAECSGLPAGYAVANHETWQPAGDFHVWVGVSPDQRLKGVGGALWASIEGFVAAGEARVLRSEVREGFPEALGFAERRGFVETGRSFESVLDLSVFDETPFADIRPRLELEGFRFTSLAGLPVGGGSLERLYRLNTALNRDIPGDEDEASIGFDEWADMVAGAAWFRPEGQLVAEYRGELVGMSAVQLLPERRGAYNLVTGVLPPFRRRGLATALKVEAVRYAGRNGAEYIRTSNDSTNRAMLAVNEKLGYSPEAGTILLEKRASRSG